MAPILTASLTPGGIGLPRTPEDIAIAHFTYKCLTKLAIHVWQKLARGDYPEYSPWVPQIASQSQSISHIFQFDEFFKSSGFQMQSLYEHRITITTSLNSSNLPNAAPVLPTIEKITRHMRAFGKFFRRLQQLETKKFVLLPLCTDIVLYYWSKVVQSTEVSPELINGTPLRITTSRFSLK
jgi:hypothetical protein